MLKHISSKGRNSIINKIYLGFFKGIKSKFPTNSSFLLINLFAVSELKSGKKS